MPELINANPTIYKPSKTSHRILTETEEQEEFEDIIDSQEVFAVRSFFQTVILTNTFKKIYTDLIRSISDPEHPLTLEELNVTQLDHIKVDDVNAYISIEFTPTIPHCSMATLIGLCIRVRLLRSLPERFKVDIMVRKGTHQSEQAVNKQLNDKERVAAALENNHLLEVVNQCLSSAHKRGNVRC
ncbi:1211_t:CDS:2 [Racocetra fulgida]|uniref:1211_t:CDS:1 n=1 Tax=Racocetra fulgida TaxID=60492 RepID=A0A9N8ZT31_9GLOM|nr:1211_t:CDS:2 [Racocetra fulgida]